MDYQCHSRLLPLLSAKYNALRKYGEALWNERASIPMSASEWYVLACIQDQQPSISEIARQAEISRQASHKYVLALTEKGLVQDAEPKTPGRGRRVVLTPLGHQCFTQYLELQQQIETEISSALGSDNLQNLKATLQQDWLTETEMETQKNGLSNCLKNTGRTRLDYPRTV